jgi:hypothetical protein
MRSQKGGEVANVFATSQQNVNFSAVSQRQAFPTVTSAASRGTYRREKTSSMTVMTKIRFGT